MIKQTIRINIEISANTNTLKSEMFLKNNYEVDFTKYKSINSLLGFDSNFYTSGFHESENVVNILTINSILVNIDIISDETNAMRRTRYASTQPVFVVVVVTILMSQQVWELVEIK